MHRPLCLFAILLLANTTFAQRDLTDIPDPDPELERSTFIVPDGFEVNLYASDPLLAKPIQMNFDEKGRLWIASSEVYPHIKPGQKPTDKILVLEDRDGDGEADHTTVFEEGLLIPTGVIPGDGGAYVANSTELIHLRDTDEDGHADERRVILSGFGTEDTHHLLHTLRWGPDGCLYMNQSIYIHSHVETPYGVKRLNGGGVWRFRPETMELDVLAYGFVNPWGLHFDRWGQVFATDGAYREGINYVFPGAVFVTAPGATRFVSGLNPGSPKHCGLEIVSGRHLPESWRGSMITNDFRAHRVCRFTVTEDQAGYESRQEAEVIKSSHVAFRPIDVKMGPDGAIYIADWYNPIIQHGEVDFRDERRDHTHGRIWRVTAKDRPLLTAPKYQDLSIAELFSLLQSPESWVRLFAKRELKARPRNQTLEQLATLVRGIEGTDEASLHHRLESLWTYQTLNVVEPQLLESLLRTSDHRVRAAALRVAFDWRARWPQAFESFRTAAKDVHPRVRLEAVRAIAGYRNEEAVDAVLAATSLPRDEFLDFALWKSVRELAPVWLPALKTGELNAPVDQLAYALRALDSPDVAEPLVNLVTEQDLSGERAGELIRLAVSLGDDATASRALDLLLSDRIPPNSKVSLLDTLVTVRQQRNVKPNQPGRVAELVRGSDPDVRRAALRAAGVWQVADLREEIVRLATGDSTETALRLAAIEAVAAMGEERTLRQLAASSSAIAVRQQAVHGLTSLAPRQAAIQALELVSGESEIEADELLRPLLSRKDGPQHLIAALQQRSLAPDKAKQLLRAARNVGRGDEPLMAAIRAAGHLEDARWKLNDELLVALTKEVREQGDPHRGETVYRREELQCAKCHAIGGAGGKVGPDLISVGASAQIDYLIESLIDPNKKVKENFHSLMVLTDAGQVVSGIPVRQNDRELVLRNAEDLEVTIPAESIDETAEGRSLMPDGTVDTLTRNELVDLVRFLAELGKVGDFSVGNARWIRSWETLEWTPEAHHRLNRTSFDTAATDDAELTWRPVYTRVSGHLPLAPLPKLKPHAETPETTFLRTRVEVPASGKLALNFSSTEGVKLWIDGKPTPMEQDLVRDVTPGSHHITLAIDRETAPPEIRIGN